MTSRAPRRFIAFVLAAAGVAAGSPAFAGPPLLCHPFQIGSARSLPWDGRTAWFEGRADYKLNNLIADTESILGPSTPVIVRMETLRRAAIYASRDQVVAVELLKRLSDRVHKAGNGAAVAYLDLAYVVGAFKQLSALDRPMSAFKGRAAYLLPLVTRLDAYALVRKSLLLELGNPSLEFAAALIAADTDRAAYEAHARRARAGANADSLLALNIGAVSH